MGKKLTVLFGLLAMLFGSRVEAGRAEIDHRGCCSHHGGVCGCAGDRAKCCDGNLSPTCGCD
jgi:hypothetical protein